MKTPAVTLILALVALFAVPGALPAAETFRFFTQNNAKLPSTRRPVFYISGTIFNDVNRNLRFDPSDKSAVPSSLTLYHLVNGQWKPVNAKPVRTSSTGGFTFAVFQRGSYRVGVQYGSNPLGAYSGIRGFGLKVTSGSRRLINVPYVTRDSAARYGITTTRTPHNPPVSATPIR